jgi:chorismate mutase
LQELLAAKCNGCSKDQLDVSERELTRKIEQQTEELSVLRSKRRELLQAIGDMEEKLKQFKNNSKEEAAVARLSQKGNSKCTVKETIQLSYLPEHNSLQVGERALKKKTKERFCKESKGTRHPLPLFSRRKPLLLL